MPINQLADALERGLSGDFNVYDYASEQETLLNDKLVIEYYDTDLAPNVGHIYYELSKVTNQGICARYTRENDTAGVGEINILVPAGTTYSPGDRSSQSTPPQC